MLVCVCGVDWTEHQLYLSSSESESESAWSRGRRNSFQGWRANGSGVENAFDMDAIAWERGARRRSLTLGSPTQGYVRGTPMAFAPQLHHSTSTQRRQDAA